MDEADFSAGAPGRLVTIPDGVAFLPDPPPVDIPLTRDLLNALDGARGALGEFLGQASQVSNELLITVPLLTIEAVESNRIEGTHTHIADVLRQDVAGPPRDLDEASRNVDVLAYRRALRAGDEVLSSGQPMSQALIRGLHAELLRGGRGGAAASPGTYRQVQVLIGAETDSPRTARFVPPPPEQVPGLMDDLVRYLSNDPVLPALVTCAIAHYQLEAIHPFEDGNGRLGRLLIPLYLQSRGVIPRPILYLSAYLESHRETYYERLKGVSTRGAWTEWAVFFLEAVKAQATNSRERVARILALQRRYQERVRPASSSQAALAAIDLVMSQMWMTITQLSGYANCSYNAAKAAMELLERQGIVRRDPTLYPATWYADDLIAEIYS